MKAQKIIFLICSFVILICSFRCKDASDIQKEESEQLYECICDTLAISKGISEFKKNISIKYNREIPHDILLNSNDCYLELLLIKEELIKKYHDTNEILKRDNFGLILDNSKEDTDYIKGSNYDIHILKPAQRDIPQNCRKIYPIRDLLNCDDDSFFQNENLINWLDYSNNTLQSEENKYKKMEQANTLVSNQYNGISLNSEFVKLFFVNDEVVVVGDQVLYNQVKLDSLSIRSSELQLASNKIQETFDKASLDYKGRFNEIDRKKKEISGNEDIQRVLQNKIIIQARAYAKIYPNLKINKLDSIPELKALLEERKPYDIKDSVLNQELRMLYKEKNFNFPKKRSALNSARTELDSVKIEFEKLNKKLIEFKNIASSEIKFSVLNESKDVNVDQTFSIIKPKELKSLSYLPLYDINVSGDQSIFILYSELDKLKLLQYRNEKLEQIELTYDLNLSPNTVIVKPSFLIKEEIIYCLVNLINLDKKEEKSIQLLKFTKEKFNSTVYDLDQKNIFDVSKSINKENLTNLMGINIFESNDDLILSFIKSGEDPKIYEKHLLYTYSVEKEKLKKNSEQAINYDLSGKDNLLPVSWISSKYFKIVNDKWALMLPNSESKSIIQLMFSEDKGLNWDRVSR